MSTGAGAASDVTTLVDDATTPAGVGAATPGCALAAGGPPADDEAATGAGERWCAGCAAGVLAVSAACC